MNHLIIGLGNPGQNYNFTRHNFGFLALDFYAKTHGFTFTQSRKHQALIAEQGSTLFIKPTTFYNRVGDSVASLVRFYKLPLEQILVVCDDFTLPFGTIRFREQGSSGGNNGIKSISEQLATTDFPRLRLGTDSETRQKLGDTDFVLSKFTPEEREQLPSILTTTTQKIEDFLS